jgi:hypothetical protein
MGLLSHYQKFETFNITPKFNSENNSNLDIEIPKIYNFSFNDVVKLNYFQFLRSNEPLNPIFINNFLSI